MADHTHHAPVTEPPLNHELSDADPRPILKFLVFLVVLTLVMAGLVGFFYNYLERREAAEKTARYPMSLLDAQRPLPPPPRLQTYPFQDIKELRQTEAPLLESYDWIDRNAGIVRIPIERAMDVLAQRGLPYRKTGQAPGAPAPTTAPGSEPAGGTESGVAAPSSGSQTPTGAASGRHPTTPAHPPE